jgi:hypothetical protein
MEVVSTDAPNASEFTFVCNDTNIEVPLEVARKINVINDLLTDKPSTRDAKLPFDSKFMSRICKWFELRDEIKYFDYKPTHDHDPTRYVEMQRIDLVLFSDQPLTGFENIIYREHPSEYVKDLRKYNLNIRSVQPVQDCILYLNSQLTDVLKQFVQYIFWGPEGYLPEEIAENICRDYFYEKGILTDEIVREAFADIIEEQSSQ